jgi:hypothetical protein
VTVAERTDNVAENVDRIAELVNRLVASLVKRIGKLPADRSGVDWFRAQLRLMRDAAGLLDAFRRDYSSLMAVSLLDSAQEAVDAEAELEASLELIPDARLRATKRHTVTLSDGSVVVALYSELADTAVRATSAKVYADGKQLYQRLGDLDAETRKAVDSVIAEGIRNGLAAEAIATNLQSALADRGVLTPTYRAMRLAVTEMAMARREAARRAVLTPQGTMKSGVQGLRWTLSAAHDVVDECDDYAAGSSDGLPSGVYLPDDVPESHPNCRCVLIPEMT